MIPIGNNNKVRGPMEDRLFRQFLKHGWQAIDTAHLPAFSYDITESLLSLAPHLNRKSNLASELQAHAGQKNVGRTAREIAPKGSATHAKRRIFECLLKLISHHNEWARESNPSRLVEYSLLGTLDGTCEALLRISGRPSTDARKVDLFFKGGWQTINARPPAGFTQNTVASLIGLVPYLPKHSLRKELKVILKNEKVANTIRQFGNGDTSAVRQLLDSLHLLICRHNDWAKTAANSLLIDPLLLLSKDGTYEILQKFQLAASSDTLQPLINTRAANTLKKRILRGPSQEPEAFFIQRGWEILEKTGLQNYSTDTLGALLELSNHLQKNEQASLRKTLARIIKEKNCGEVARNGRTVGARFGARRQIFKAFYKILLSHNAWARSGEPEREIADELLLSKTGMIRALSLISRRPSLDSRKFKGFVSGGLKAINLHELNGSADGLVDSLIQLVPYLEDSHSLLRFELGRIFGQQTGRSKLVQSKLSESFQRQLHDAFFTLVRRHNDWCKKDLEQYRIPLNFLHAEKGMKKILAIFRKCSRNTTKSRAA
jgi:hypothetical protein